MYREKIEDLLKWKDSKNRMPLVIRGARQVGKTWLMKEFGKKYYEKCAYINFDDNERMESLFSGNLDIQRIIHGLSIESGINIDKENTLIIFDEVQEIPSALSSLKYFCENEPDYHIIAAGSLLGVALHQGTSFPVGKVDFLDLYPLNFKEFLIAINKEEIFKLIENKDWQLISSFKEKIIDYLKQYYFVGGMPAVVKSYIEENNYDEVRKIQIRLLESYEQDFSKHAPNNIIPRIRQLWSNIPTQLAKENKKFIYGLIKEGARAREYELALAWLIDCGLIYKINRINKPDIPLSAYQDFNAFKLYILDVGLLGAIARVDFKTLLEGNDIFEEFKGALTEQFVLEELKSNKDIPIYYWSADKSNGEIDFLIQVGANNIPIEVKSEENLMAKSLKNFVNKYNTKINIRTSMSNYRKEDWLINIPLYAIGNVKNIITEI